MTALHSAAIASFEAAIASGRFKTGRHNFEDDGSPTFRETVAIGAVTRGVWPAALCPAWLALLLDAVFVALPPNTATLSAPNADDAAGAAAQTLLQSMHGWSTISPTMWTDIRRLILADLVEDVSTRSIQPSIREDGWQILRGRISQLAGFIRFDDGVPPSHVHPAIVAHTFALEHEIELFHAGFSAVDSDEPGALASFFARYSAALVSLSGALDNRGASALARGARHEAALTAIGIIANAIAQVANNASSPKAA